MESYRQQILVLYLENSALDSDTIGWARYDGTGENFYTTGDSFEAPYATALDALMDGWRLFQASQLIPGSHGDAAFLKHEFLFERMESVND